jgi:hypothetical protein
MPKETTSASCFRGASDSSTFEVLMTFDRKACFFGLASLRRARVVRLRADLFF